MHGKELKELIFSAIRDDATVKALLGTTVSEPRIYHKYPDIEAEKLLGHGSQAYVLYFLEASGGTNFNKISHTHQIGELTLVVDIYASDEAEDTLFSLYDRIFTIFNGQNFENTYWRVLGFKSDNFFRDFEEWNKDLNVIHHRNFRFVSTNTFSKTSLVSGAV